MAKIVLSVTNDIETDNRVNKVAKTLLTQGHEVTVIGVKRATSHELQTPYRTERFKMFFSHSVLFYAEFNIRLFFRLLRKDCDILLANDTDSILPNFITSMLRGKKLVVDLHELFPEVPELVGRNVTKWVWTKIEDITFPHIKHGYTVCKSIADYYAEKYDINLGIVRNIPNRKEYTVKSKKLNYGGRKIILYQGAMNVGRGIEWIIKAMPYIEDAVFVIIGDGDKATQIKELIKDDGLEDRVFMLGRIPAEQLPAYTGSADLGVCLLEKMGLSYYFSLPNRIFDFMQSHVPMLATDFPEISAIINTYHTGRTISHYEPRYLARVITEMLNEEINHETYEKASMELNWENESQQLLKIINA